MMSIAFLNRENIIEHIRQRCVKVTGNQWLGENVQNIGISVNMISP